MKTKILALLATASLLLSQVASASTFNIFNTGVDASGNVVADQTVGDLHYQLISAPPGAPATIKAGTSASGFPIGPWVGDSTASRWIGPNEQAFNGPAGLYIYRTTFTLTASQLAGASLTGNWSADDGLGAGAGIFLNSVNVAGPAATYASWTSFAINSGFVLGLNSLDFALVNAGGPTGLRVEADQVRVPEPASLALLGLGLLGLAVSRRKSNNA